MGIQRRMLWEYSGGCCGSAAEDVVGVQRRMLWEYSGGCCGSATEDAVGIQRRMLLAGCQAIRLTARRLGSLPGD